MQGDTAVKSVKWPSLEDKTEKDCFLAHLNQYVFETATMILNNMKKCKK